MTKLPSPTYPAEVVTSSPRDDFALLQSFVHDGDEQAFTELVHRHISLVFSSAVRQVRNYHLAQDITQAVFLLLARKASTFSEDIIVSAWLFRASRLAAANILRSEFRRKGRDAEALPVEASTSSTEQSWEMAAPFLDEAIGSLAEQDQAAISLRFFERRTLHEIGTTLGITHETAKKRVSRALGKLQIWLKRRGVALSSVALATLLAERIVEAAPEAIVSSTVAASLSKTSLSAAGASALQAASRGLRVSHLPIIVSGGLLLFGLFSATIVSRGFFVPESAEPLKAVIRQSQKALRDGDAAKYVQFITFTDEELRQLRPVIEESIRSQNRLKTLLVKQFGRASLVQPRWPLAFDEIFETEILGATETLQGRDGSLQLQRGGRLTFARLNGLWKINLYSVPGEPLTASIQRYNRRRAAMDYISNGLEGGAYKSGAEALAAYRKQLF